MITATTILICTLAALFAGFIDSVAGGGGLITIPTLLLAGVPPHTTLACNKVSSSLGTAMALGTFARSGLVIWRLAAIGTGFALVGSAIGSRLALTLDPQTLGKVLIVLLPFAMLATLIPRKDKELPLVFDGPRFYLLAPLCCFVVGIYDGFFGPATGSFFILALHLIVRVHLLQASATTKVLNLSSNIGAAIVFIISGEVVWSLALCMAVGSITGNWMGSRMAIRIGGVFVQRVLIVSLSILMLSLIWTYFIKG